MHHFRLSRSTSPTCHLHSLSRNTRGLVFTFHSLEGGNLLVYPLEDLLPDGGALDQAEGLHQVPLLGGQACGQAPSGRRWLDVWHLVGHLL